MKTNDNAYSNKPLYSKDMTDIMRRINRVEDSLNFSYAEAPTYNFSSVAAVGAGGELGTTKIADPISPYFAYSTSTGALMMFDVNVAGEIFVACGAADATLYSGGSGTFRFSTSTWVFKYTSGGILVAKYNCSETGGGITNIALDHSGNLYLFKVSGATSILAYKYSEGGVYDSTITITTSAGSTEPHTAPFSVVVDTSGVFYYSIKDAGGVATAPAVGGTATVLVTASQIATDYNTTTSESASTAGIFHLTLNSAGKLIGRVLVGAGPLSLLAYSTAGSFLGGIDLDGIVVNRQGARRERCQKSHINGSDYHYYASSSAHGGIHTLHTLDVSAYTYSSDKGAWTYDTPNVGVTKTFGEESAANLGAGMWSFSGVVVNGKAVFFKEPSNLDITSNTSIVPSIMMVEMAVATGVMASAYRTLSIPSDEQSVSMVGGKVASGASNFSFDVDDSGNVYVLDIENQIIRKWDSSGVFERKFGGTSVSAGALWGATRIACAGDSFIIVYDHQVQEIIIYNATGTVTGSFSVTSYPKLVSIAASTSAIYGILTTSTNYTLVKWSYSGVEQATLVLSGTVYAHLAVGLNGFVYTGNMSVSGNSWDIYDSLFTLIDDSSGVAANWKAHIWQYLDVFDADIVETGIVAYNSGFTLALEASSQETPNTKIMLSSPDGDILNSSNPVLDVDDVFIGGGVRFKTVGGVHTLYVCNRNQVYDTPDGETLRPIVKKWTVTLTLTSTTGGGGGGGSQSFDQTEFNLKPVRYAEEDVSMGIPDGGVNIPATDALVEGIVGEKTDFRPYHYIEQARRTIERLITQNSGLGIPLNNPATNTPYNWNDSDADNLYFAAMSEGNFASRYGLSSVGYRWSRPHIVDPGSKINDVDIGELDVLSKALERAAISQGLIT